MHLAGVLAFGLALYLNESVGCSQVLAGKLDSPEAEEVWLDACNASFTAMIKDKQRREAQEAKATVCSSPQFSLSLCVSSFWYA